MEYVPKANDLCEWGAGRKHLVTVLSGARVCAAGLPEPDGRCVLVRVDVPDDKAMSFSPSDEVPAAVEHLRPLRPTAAGQRVRNDWNEPGKTGVVSETELAGSVLCVVVLRDDDGGVWSAPASDFVRIADAPVAWVPKVGERVRVTAGRRALSITGIGDPDASQLLGREGRVSFVGTGYCPIRVEVPGFTPYLYEIEHLEPVADRDVKPAKAAAADPVADLSSTVPRCSSPWHAQPCRCESGWVRGKEAEPEAREVWAAREKSGEWYTYADRHGVCERLYIVGADKRTLHPTPEGCVALWKTRRP